MLAGMPVGLDTVADISRAVALEHGRGLSIDAVTTTEGTSDRAEVLVTISGCHNKPCRFLINVTRWDGEEFEREFRAKLGDALRQHASVR